ncbi:MAG: hypothetical protein J5U17_02600 [Candidatus Methanoperedens sp.]|nr:hypothetical protein [Candidatus Methanoperedens sp.]MCE8424649.1 hypothetical protein [Candidatus Methanoperedens sp.]MCE8426900.1 hypothetical protein [Candidatus Methanoperedens sp.]
MMKIADILRKLSYAILFGFTGLILGIWTADLFYGLGLKNMDRHETIYVSLFIIIFIGIAASLFGFTKGKDMLES